MTKLKVYNKTKNILLEELSVHINLEFMSDKLIGKDYLDIYFHSGEIDKNAINLILHSNVIVVNSNRVKYEILNKIDINESKVQVIYPSIRKSTIRPIEAKKEICKEFNIDVNDVIIFFTANNLKINGIKELFNIISLLSEDNYKIIIASNSKQIRMLKFQISRDKIAHKIIYFEDYKNLDFLYAACDIFILPTYVKHFSTTVLRAMALKSAVLISSNNDASEIVDVFSTMETPTDPNSSFKIDSILSKKDELELIKEQNWIQANELNVDKQIKRLLSILNLT